MAKISKKEFFEYMSALYEDKYRDNEAYKILLDIIKRAEEPKFVKQIQELASMTTRERLHYRYTMAVMGKEFTPLQIDQYISLIKYALKHIEKNTDKDTNK